MKKALIACLFLMLSHTLINAQTVTGTLVGIGNDSVGVYARPSADISNFTALNIVFCISILDQGAGNPTASDLASGIKIYTPNLILDANTVLTVMESGRMYYCFNLVDNSNGLLSTWTTAGSNIIASIKFNNLTTLAASMRLENLPEGGSNGFMSWYVAMQGATGVGGDGVLTPSTSSSFFGTSDNPATNVNGGNSFVPLQTPAVLPVKFTSFIATAYLQDANLTWEVAGETTSTDRYEVERSYNGKDFETISSVAKSNTASVNGKQYTAKDANIMSRLASNAYVYYRIKEVTRTGKFFYSDIRNIKMGDQPTFTVNLFPNPAHDVLIVNINMIKTGDVITQVYDASGKLALTQSSSVMKGGNTLQLNVQSLQPGTYFIKVNTGDQVKTTRFVIN